MANYIEWNLPASKPLPNIYIIAQTLDGEYIVDRPTSFNEWSEMVVRWAYLPPEIDAKIENILSDLEFFKEENERLKVDLKNATEKLKNEKELKEHRIDYLEEQNKTLKKQVEDWHNKYLDLLGKYHNEHQRDAFVGKRSKFAIDDYCGSVNSDGDECPATDDLCGVCKSDDARPVSEISIDELRDIFLKVLREAKERERVEEDDGK